MFVLVAIEDKIKIKPDSFDKDFHEVLEEQIEVKYSNKIVLDAGLCVTFYDYIDVGDPMVYPSEGGAHVQVKFRMVVFRPFPGEIVEGKIVESTSLGLKVSVGFFQDILIPPHYLQSPSFYDSTSSSWTWKYENEGVKQDFVISIGNEIRFRVKTINFTSLKSTAKGIEKLVTSEMHMRSSDHKTVADEPRQTVRHRSSSITAVGDESTSPMQIIGTIAEDGLGATIWWQD